MVVVHDENPKARTGLIRQRQGCHFGFVHGPVEVLIHGRLTLGGNPNGGYKVFPYPAGLRVIRG